MGSTTQRDSYYQQPYSEMGAPQFVTSRGMDDYSSVKIEESRGWRSQFGDDEEDERSCCSRFKFAIWASIAVLLIAAIIAVSVTMVTIHNNQQASSGEAEFTPPGVLTPSSPDASPGGSSTVPGKPGANVGVPPGAPPSSDKDGTLEIMKNPPFPVPSGWTALWWDEFDGTALNTEWWNYNIGYGQEYGLWAWGNLEQEYYTDSPANVNVSNGKLHVTALKQETVLPDGYTFNYTSGRINTMGKLAVYGGMNTSDGRKWNTIRIDASLKAPQPSECSSFLHCARRGHADHVSCGAPAQHLVPINQLCIMPVPSCPALSRPVLSRQHRII